MDSSRSVNKRRRTAGVAVVGLLALAIATVAMPAAAHKGKGKPHHAGFKTSQAAMLDPDAFPEPKRLRPDRDPNLYLHLGHSIHPCSGRVVNQFQIPLLVGGLLRRGLAGVGSIEWASAFPHRMMARLRN